MRPDGSGPTHLNGLFGAIQQRFGGHEIGIGAASLTDGSPPLSAFRIACHDDPRRAVDHHRPLAGEVGEDGTDRGRGADASDEAADSTPTTPSATTQPERECVPSDQHRLLGEDARHRALRRCLGDRGQEGRGEVAGGVDAGHAGLAALVDLEDDAGGRIHRREAQ